MSDTPMTDNLLFKASLLPDMGLRIDALIRHTKELERERNILHDFVESIVDAEGPFGLFNGTSIVYAAYDTMAKVKGVTNGR